MNLSLNERRRRLRELAQTHAGLVLASALLERDGAARTPHAPLTDATGVRAANAPGATRPRNPASAQRLEVLSSNGGARRSKPTPAKGAVLLKLW